MSVEYIAAPRHITTVCDHNRGIMTMWADFTGIAPHPCHHNIGGYVWDLPPERQRQVRARIISDVVARIYLELTPGGSQ